MFQITPRAIHHRDAPAEQLTQIGRALKELNIEWIAAHSPQAKGRIERAFQTAQDRLVKGLRQVGAKDLQTANAYLQHVYVPLWNEHFTRQPHLAGDAHRAVPAGTDLDSVLSIQESGTVGQDQTVRWQGVLYRLGREQMARGMRGARVQVEWRLDGSRWMHWRKRFLPLERGETSNGRACCPPPSYSRAIGGGESAGPAANSRCPPSLVRSLRPVARSTDLASHDRLPAAS